MTSASAEHPNAEHPDAYRATALTIAGSDSSGGAGIQADLKTFAAFETYGASVITALTAQNTTGVQAVHTAPAEFVGAQIDSVLTDLTVSAIKTGMLANREIIEIVAERLKAAAVQFLVVDPVMVARSGDSLLNNDAVEGLKRHLLPLAYVVTPNLPETEVLIGEPLVPERRLGDVRAWADSPGDVIDRARLEDAARAIADMGPTWVVIKGGHAAGPAVDLVYDGHGFFEAETDRIDTPHSHGTGCTFSAAITAELALGASPFEAIAQAKIYVTEALTHAYAIGAGHSPVHHFYGWWKP